MIGAVRLFVIGFAVLSVVYWLVSIYSRSVRREKLEDRWAEEHPDDSESEARSTYIQQGMDDYRSGLRRKLILLVYIVPAVLVFVALFVINAN